MDSILLLLALFCVAKTLLMTSLLPRRRGWLVVGVLCAAAVGAMHPYALEQNKLALEQAMEGQKLLTDVSLAVMCDLLLTLGFCLSQTARLGGEPRSRFARLLGWIPSPLVLPALYYFQLNLFFNCVGVDFALLTGGLALVALLLMTAGAWGLERLLPEAELRLEMTALLAVLTFLLVVCCTVFHPEAMIYTHSSPVAWDDLALTCGVVAVLFVAGFYQKRIVKLFKKKK